MKHLAILVLRWIFSWIDLIVVWAIELLYVLLIKIADTNVLGDLIYHYLGRIYTFLGIFMVFKLSLSIINYIVNPDALTDKSKGFSKLITNVVISLVLLAITPNIFDAAFKLQSDLLGQNVIYQIVTGKKLATGGTMEDNAKAQGKSMSYAVYSSFIYPSSISDASNIAVNEIIVENCKSSDGAGCLLSNDVIAKEDSDDKFVYEYKFIISTICGCAVVYMLFTFCFQAALRAVKLSFLQIIAPIPILSMIDPKTGTSKISKWGKECGKTYIDLFIRLAAIFFALDIIHNVIEGSDGVMITFSTGQPVTNLLVRLFIIIGCLMFAKQMPQLISDILGIKLDGGGFSLKKQLSGLPGMGLAKTLGAGAIGYAGGMAANAWATKGNWKGKGFLNGLRNTGSIIAGAHSGAVRGLAAKDKNMFKAAGNGIRGASAARNLRADRKAAGDGGLSGYRRRLGVSAANLAGIPSGASKFDKQISSYDNFLKEQASLYSYAESKVAEDAGFMVDNFTYTQADGTEFTWNGGAINLAQEQAALNKMEQDPTVDTAILVNQRSLVEAMKKKAVTDYITMNKEDGAAVQAALSNLEYMRSTDSSINAEISASITDGASVEAAKKIIKGAKSRTTSSSEYRKAQINKKNDAKK